MNNHGGKRKGASRPITNIDIPRMLTLLSRGVNQKIVAASFGVGPWVISRAFRRANNKPTQ